MESEVIAIGSFSYKIAGFMEYAKEYRREKHEGIPVVKILFHIYNGTNVSVEMASSFGVPARDKSQF